MTIIMFYLKFSEVIYLLITKSIIIITEHLTNCIILDTSLTNTITIQERFIWNSLGPGIT